MSKKIEKGQETLKYLDKTICTAFIIFLNLDINLPSPGVHAGHFAPYNACTSAPKRFTSAYEQAYYCIARAAQKHLGAAKLKKELNIYQIMTQNLTYFVLHVRFYLI